MGAPGGGAAPEVTQRIKAWVAPLTGANSMDILKLRAYCGLHAKDRKIPAVYPLRAIGLAARYRFTLPCHFWTCVMTEARWDGKLPFWVALAFFGILNYIHYRSECQSCGGVAKLLGSGQSRIWWAWFWATLLPLWLVMLVQTTFDAELTDLIGQGITYIWTTTTDWVSETTNQITMGVIAVVALLTWTYWEKVRTALGLETHTFLPNLFSRTQDQDEERIIQVCVWRLDLNSEPLSADLTPREPERGADDTDQAAAAGVGGGWFGGNAAGSVSTRTAMTLIGGGGWGKALTPRWMPMMPISSQLFKGEEDISSLRTHDGRVPSLSVRFHYGSEMIQSTRAVRPSWAEWRAKGTVYIQENFKVGLDWRPGVPLRVEVRDMCAPLGPVSLGECVFDSGKLLRQLEASKKAEREFTSVPVVQVVRMLAPPAPSTAPGAQSAQITQLKSLGFAPFTLSGGGAIWLSFADVATKPQGEGFPSCC